MYNETNPDDDPREKYEEMNRMREHVVRQMDKNNDRMISLEEFMKVGMVMIQSISSTNPHHSIKARYIAWIDWLTIFFFNIDQCLSSSGNKTNQYFRIPRPKPPKGTRTKDGRTSDNSSTTIRFVVDSSQFISIYLGRRAAGGPQSGMLSVQSWRFPQWKQGDRVSPSVPWHTEISKLETLGKTRGVPDLFYWGNRQNCI